MRGITPCNQKIREIKPCNQKTKEEVDGEQGTSDSRLPVEQGYRSKSARKLLQMNKEQKFLKSAKSVLDLCAAPGSWMQVALNKTPQGSFVLGVDLRPIRAIPGAISCVGDITTTKCKTIIAKHMRMNGVKTFDVVLFDGSPIVGDDKAEAAMTTLVINSLKIATEFLSPGGTLVAKIFQSQESNWLTCCLGHLFEKVELQRPSTFRGTFTELYFVGKFFKASIEIHPRLFDVKYLSDEHERPFGKYTFGDPERFFPVPAIRRNVSASTFVWSESPRAIFDRAASFSLDNPYLKDHSLTTDKVKAFCKDLLVLGKQDLEHLLEWRMHMRTSLSSSSQKDSPKAYAEDEIDSDVELISERQAKGKLTGTQIDALEDCCADHESSSLSSIKGNTGCSTQEGKKRKKILS